jgi:hypothetical protein
VFTGNIQVQMFVRQFRLQTDSNFVGEGFTHSFSFLRLPSGKPQVKLWVA